MEHSFNTNIAAQHDVDIAILIHNFKFWTFNNLANKRNVYDGFCWSYDTLEALGDIFPYWTRRQLERIINNAVEAELIQKGNYNQTKYDRTVWYALTPKAYAYYPELLKEKYLELLYLSISPNGEIDFAKWRNRFPQTVTPIPDTKPDTKPYIINNISASNEAPDDIKNNSELFVENKEEINNQALGINVQKQVIDLKEEPTKSDYHNNRTKKCAILSKNEQYDIKNILEDNIFQIPKQLIEDWITNRKKKRAAVTKTAWSKINKELGKCKQEGVEPIEAFEKMVAHGWQALDAEWFHKEKKSSYSQWDVESVMRA